MKRVEHLIYVSLKYTRTVDVLVNIINRMMDAYDFLIQALLKYALSRKMITSLPETPIEREQLAKDMFTDDIVLKNIDLINMYRKILKSPLQRINEYRRHVTLIAKMDGKEERIDIDNISAYHELQKEFVEYVERLIRGPKDEFMLRKLHR
ncbi:MAG: hypothetical protein V1725_02830 [archaeon]